ncbi:MAG: DUF2652 domain-containing protein [Rhizobiaceae bacterium]|nr:DUF2652 domain-containing protein [Rhizobiaceae bacterium]
MVELMNEHMWHDWQHNTNIMFSLAGLFIILLIVFSMVRLHNKRADNYLSTNLVQRSAKIDNDTTPDQQRVSEARDTIFILPDISHYTRFMASSHFTDQTAQFIIFSLINTMIKAATKTLELSKVEGDAVLFFVDAEKHSKQVIGGTLTDIFNAFYIERERLMASNLCSCQACPHIQELDIKIFIHRGKTTRFKFRGSIDHFGQDIIVLYRMMKNSISSDHYALITDAAVDSIELPEELEQERISIYVEDIGTIDATKFESPKQEVRNWQANSTESSDP